MVRFCWLFETLCFLLALLSLLGSGMIQSENSTPSITKYKTFFWCSWLQKKVLHFVTEGVVYTNCLYNRCQTTTDTINEIAPQRTLVYTNRFMVTAGALPADPTTCFIPDLFIGSMKETSELTIMLEYEVRI